MTGSTKGKPRHRRGGSTKVTRRRLGAGYSIPGAADALDVPYKRLRKVIELKQARTIKFGGQEILPQSEVERLREMLAGEGSDAA